MSVKLVRPLQRDEEVRGDEVESEFLVQSPHLDLLPFDFKVLHELGVVVLERFESLVTRVHDTVVDVEGKRTVDVALLTQHRSSRN